MTKERLSVQKFVKFSGSKTPDCPTGQLPAFAKYLTALWENTCNAPSKQDWISLTP